MSSIEIFNPREKPYGMLSNNAKHDMLINKEIWKSVTQFIYSNMVNNYAYKDKIKKSKKIFSEYIECSKNLEKDIISSSLEEALKVKFENPDLLKILLSTGDADILYISPNSFLGIGNNEKGDNILGKYLVQLRNHIVNTKIKDEKLAEEQDELYSAYIIYTTLKNEMIYKGNDLSEYLYLKSGPTKIFDIHLVNKLDDIILIYIKNNPTYRKTYESLLMDKENKKFFLDLYNRKDPELYPLLKYAILNPSVIILYLRKKYLGSVRENQEIIKYNNVFNMYLEYILETKYPGINKENYETVIANELQKQHFTDDSQYVKELNVINEKKKNVENKKVELSELNKIQNLKEIQSSIKNYKKTLLVYENDIKDIGTIENLEKNIKKLESKKEDIKKLINSDAENGIYKNIRIHNIEIHKINENIKDIKSNFDKIKQIKKNTEDAEQNIKILENKETELLNQNVPVLKSYTEDQNILDQIKKYTEQIKTIKGYVDNSGKKSYIVKGKLALDEEKLEKISEFKYKIQNILKKIYQVKKEYERKLNDLNKIYRFRINDSEEVKENKKKQLELEIENFKNNYYEKDIFVGLQVDKEIKSYDEVLKELYDELKKMRDEIGIPQNKKIDEEILELKNKRENILKKISKLSDKDDLKMLKEQQKEIDNQLNKLKFPENMEEERLQDEIKKYKEELMFLQSEINKIKDIGGQEEFANIRKMNYIENEIKKEEQEILDYEKKLSTFEKVKIYVNIDNIKKRIFFVREKLPFILRDKINTFLLNLKIPTEEEVLFSKTFNLDSYGNLTFDDDFLKDAKIPKKQIKIYQGNPSRDYIGDLELIKRNSYQLLSPVYYTGMLRIKNFDYPTVTHYIIANLFANMPIIKKDVDLRLLDLEKIKREINIMYEEEDITINDEKLKKLKSVYDNRKSDLKRIYENDTQNVLTYNGNLKEAQQYILKDPTGQTWNKNTPTNWIDYKTLYDKYFNISIIKQNERLKELAIIGINKKFEDRSLQNLLILTENKNIIYNDKKDNILGVGKNNTGENFVGNYLMRIRDDVFTQQNLENIEILSEENVTNIIETDVFMTNWLEMKVKDMCNVVKKVKNYSKIKYDLDIKNNELFYKIVLDKIFKTCSNLFLLSEKVTAEVPLYFVKIVNKYIKEKYNPSIVKLLWQRIVVMIYYIIKNVKEPTLYHIKNILLKVELLVSKEQNCVSIIKNDELQNCIFSAIINIITGIFQYNNTYNKNKEKLFKPNYEINENTKSIHTLINKYDVELAVSIILNTKNIIHLDIKENKRFNTQIESDSDEENNLNEEDEKYVGERNNDKINEDDIDDVYDETEQRNEDDDEDDKLEDDISERESLFGSDDEDYDKDEEYNNEKEYDEGDYDGSGKEEKNKIQEEQINNYYKTILIEYINNNNIFDKKNDIKLISQYIVHASNFIKKYEKIPEKIKINRINFFATIRS